MTSHEKDIELIDQFLIIQCKDVDIIELNKEYEDLD